jgi:hypothetical protein
MWIDATPGRSRAQLFVPVPYNIDMAGIDLEVARAFAGNRCDWTTSDYVGASANRLLGWLIVGLTGLSLLGPATIGAQAETNTESLAAPSPVHNRFWYVEGNVTLEREFFPQEQPPSGILTGYGSSVALAGKMLVIGEPGRTEGDQLYIGGAFVYLEPSDGWGTAQPIAAAKLSASDARKQVEPALGDGVAMSADTIVLACGNYSGFGAYSTEMYVYVKPANGWTSMTESARLQSPNASLQLQGAVAIEGDTIVAGCVDTSFTGIGSAGAVAIYVKPPQGWSGNVTPIAVLTDGGLNDSLGSQVAISGDTIAVAAPEATVGQGGYGSGDVQIYEKPGGGWATTSIPAATLYPSDPNGGYLGYRLGLSGDTVVAGFPYAAVKGQLNGAAYVFQRSGLHWRTSTETARLTANTGPFLGDGSPTVGIGVAIEGDLIAVGASGASPPDGAYYGGEVFIYRRQGTRWHSTSKYTALAYDPNADPTLQLGISEAISGNTIVTGSWGIDFNLKSPGGVLYLFRLR